MDLDIISIETKRDVGKDDCPTFSITLIYRDDWYKKIGANDFLEITMGRGKKSGPVLFGMVDTISRGVSFVELKPERSITISGRGFNKAIMQFGIGAVQEVDFSFQFVGFFEGQGQGFSQTTPAQLIKTAYEYYADKGIDIKFANGKSWKEYVKRIYLENSEEEDLTLGNTMGYYSYQGGLWEYLKELRNAPFYEMFYEIIDGKLTFIVRPTPFNPDDWKNLRMFKVDERDVIDDQVGRTDLETYTVYAVKGESIVSGLDNVFGLPIWYEPFYGKYGLRRLEVQSKYTRGGEAPNPQTLVYGEVQMGGGAGGDLAYPTPTKHGITSYFGPRKKVTSADSGNHKGIDIGAPRGTPIYAAADGIVKLVTQDRWRGHYIEVDHGNGMVTRYQHCNTRPNAPVGSQVKRGQVIAQVGSSGDSTGPHLHFEVLINGKAVNPLPYVGGNKGGGNKGGSGYYPDAPIRSVDWNVNEGTSNKDEDRQKKIDKYIESYMQEGKTEALGGVNSKVMEEALKWATTIGSAVMPGFESLTKNPEELLKKYLEAHPEVVERQTNVDHYNATETTVSVSQKTIDLFNWNIKNNYMENGAIILKGNHEYQVGTRLYMQSSDMEYYIENVAHSFVYNQSWTTTLQVTRGLPYGTRFEKPWNEWKIITASDLEKITGISQATMNKPIPGMAVPGTTGQGEEMSAGNLIGSVEGDTANGIKYYSQLEAPHASTRYGGGTIKNWGCGPTSMAMIMSTYTGKNISPTDAANFASRNGHVGGGGTSWSFFNAYAKSFGYRAIEVGTNRDKAIQAVAGGKLVVFRVNRFPPSGNHIMVLSSVKGDKITINDPASRKNTAKEYSPSVLNGIGARFWIIDK